MNHLHLQETAKHYAKLAEEAQTQLQEEQELNEGLIQILDVLCEELGIDMNELLETTFSNVVGSRGGAAAIGRAKYLKDLLAARQKNIVAAARAADPTLTKVMSDAEIALHYDKAKNTGRMVDLLRKHAGMSVDTGGTSHLQWLSGEKRLTTGQISPEAEKSAEERLKAASPARRASAARRAAAKTGVASI